MAKKKFWTSDRIVSFSAMFISLLTLLIFIRQTNIIDRQSKLSAMPYLMMSMSNKGDAQTIGIDIVNHGLGPAIIESTTMYYKGKAYEMQLLDFLKTQVAEMDSVPVLNVTDFGEGVAIPSEDRVNLLTAGGTDKGYAIFKEAVGLVMSKDFDYKIVYKSVYNDRWEIVSGTNIPKKMN